MTATRCHAGHRHRPARARKNVMDRFIDGIEWIAAFFVGIVALNTFIAVLHAQILRG